MAGPGLDASAREAARLIGRHFGEFVVRELISSGGFGMVFRAEQPALAREAVIKVLHTRHRASEVVAQRFLREAQLASRLDHPYAAHTYAFGAEPDGVLWIAMELVRGTPLDRLLEAQGPIALEAFVPLLERLCEVVHTAHEQGIVHRDLKPGNVMVLRRAGRYLPKLLDLGIAKHAAAAAPSAPGAAGAPAADAAAASGAADRDPALDATLAGRDDGGTSGDGASAATTAADAGRLTEHGAAMGSPLYMAPEQWVDAGDVDARTDQYALGVLAYEALTGRAPFGGTTKVQIALAHARQPPPPLGPGLPPALDAVLARALAKRSADRYATVLELAAAFRAASGVASEPVSLPRLPERLRADVLARAPEPLAAAVAALDAARNAHQARDALWQLVRVAVRLLALTALAAHAHVGAGGGAAAATSQPAIGDALRGLRRRTLGDADWLELARELCRPFAAIADAHPVPELVALVTGDARRLTELLAVRAAADAAGGGSDAQVRAVLERALPLAAAVLEELAFLSAYPLVVPDGDGAAEVWMGARAGARPTLAVRGRALAAGEPALVDAGGVPVLSLWPFVQRHAPAPGAAPCLFLLDGHARADEPGRRGARLVALPDAFERDDDAPWEALGVIVRDTPDDGASTGGAARERCPFPGLAAFTADDAASFFGRERETLAFVNRLRVTPLLAVVGPSGAGKSSFVQAGVLPALPAGWTAVTVRPGAAPIEALAARLGGAGWDTGDLRAELDEHPGALGTILRARATARDQTLVIVVDQLEELFTLCDDAAERARYVDALVRAARSADDPVRVVATLRDDFLLHAEALPALRTRLGPALQLVTTPAPAELRRILVEPVAAAGYEFDDPALPDEMIAAIAEAPGALPLLSFTAARLWELRDRRFRQLGRKAYATLGGVGGALAQHAEATLEAMGTDERRLVREVFRHLVTAEGTRAVMSRTELDQVLGGGSHAATVVEKLVAARLVVVAEAERGGERVEVAHEALLGAWPRLVEWRREDAEGARLRDQLRAAARQWEERGRAAGLLWRGDALAEYRLWRARTPGALTAVEEAFAAASLADAARGRKVRTISIVTAFAVLAAGVGLLWIENGRANGERARAESAAAATAAANAELHDNLMRQYENQGRRLILDGDPLQGLAYLQQAAAYGAHGRAHDFLVAEAVRATDGERWEGKHDASATSPRFSRDGTRLVTGSLDGTARIWDAASGRVLARLVGHTDGVLRASFSPDDRLVLTASFDGTAAIWDATTGARQRVLAHGAPVWCARFLPDGTGAVTASADGTFTRWDVATGAIRWRVQLAGVAHTACDVAPDGATVAVGDAGGAVRVVDAAGGAVLATFVDQHDRVRDLRFSPDGAALASASRDGTAVLWDLRARRRRWSISHGAAVLSVAFSPDGRRLVTASNDHAAVVWDVASGAKVVALTGHAAGVNAATFTPDGADVITVSDDDTARRWDATTGRVRARWFGRGGALNDARLDDRGARLATVSPDGTVIVWDPTPQARVTTLRGHDGAVDHAAFSADGARVVTAGHDGTARIWDATTGRPLQVLRGHTGTIHWAEFGPSGAAVATAGTDGTVRLWDATSGAQLHVLVGHTGDVNQVAWSRDGARVFSAGVDGTIRAWSVADGAPLRSVRAHGGEVLSLAVSPDGSTLVTTGVDAAIRFWSADDLRPRRALEHRDGVTAVSFAPSGPRAVALDGDHMVIWDVPTGKNLAPLLGHTGASTFPVAPWSPDGALVVTGSLDGTARIWDAATGDTLAIFDEAAQVWSSGFSPDGRAILVSSDDGTAEIRQLPDLTISDDQLRRLIRCRVPFKTEGDRVVPATTDPSACTR